MLSYPGFAAKTQLPNYAGARELPRAFITAVERIPGGSKKRLAGDTERQASSGEVKDLRREINDLKELVAEFTPENHRTTALAVRQKRGLS